MSNAIDIQTLLHNPKAHPLVVALDHLEDPYNFGAIIRSACAFGVSAIIYPKDRQVNVTPGVISASANTVDHMPLLRVTNVAQTLDILAHAGYWIYGLDGYGKDVLDTFKPNFPCILVAGNEHRGLSPLLKKKAHGLIKIPMASHVESLNVSVATGIALYQFSQKKN